MTVNEMSAAQATQTQAQTARAGSGTRLELDGISVAFPGVLALDNVSFEVRCVPARGGSGRC